VIRATPPGSLTKPLKVFDAGARVAGVALDRQVLRRRRLSTGLIAHSQSKSPCRRVGEGDVQLGRAARTADHGVDLERGLKCRRSGRQA